MSARSVEYSNAQIAIVVHRAVLHHQVLRIAQGLRARKSGSSPASAASSASRGIRRRAPNRKPSRPPNSKTHPSNESRHRGSSRYGNIGKNNSVLHVILDPDILTVQEKVVGTVRRTFFRSTLRQCHSVSCALGICTVLEPDTVHLAKHLRRLDPGVAHAQIARIPQRSAGSLRKKTFPYDKAVVMPERIFSLETTPTASTLRHSLSADSPA